ncbi:MULTISPECIES: hypothetical protein [Halobacteriales]|uniref:Uncharacterized protein n=2 Tax=Halobacteriales TaxID=2235 RepID=A0A1I0NIF7_9EURY|nr:hypothetical protein [Natrinema salifodinae]SEW01249.1 hypothetical protein SAMN05216285_1774 [Natrinema salifodinae]
MTQEDLRENIAFRHIDDEWHHHNSNVIYRIFKLKEFYDEIRDHIETLEGFVEQCGSEEKEPSKKLISDSRRAILRLMRNVEAIAWNFPHLAHESWFGSFKEDIAHGYWRIEEMRYQNAESDPDERRQLCGEARRICENTSEAFSQGILGRLTEFFEFMDVDFHMKDTPKEYKSTIREAADLYCLGYYSTALLVLGRAVEKCLLQLGRDRKVKSIRAYNDEIDWEDARFHFRNKALNRIDMPEKHGKVLSDRQYHQIAILIKYRNNVAHSDYEQVGRDEALRQCMSALDLLEELNELRSHLRELDDESIRPVSNQKAQ